MDSNHLVKNGIKAILGTWKNSHDLFLSGATVEAENLVIWSINSTMKCMLSVRIIHSLKMCFCINSTQILAERMEPIDFV